MSAFERQLRTVVNGAVEQTRKDLQRSFDALGRQYRGRPVSVIKPAISRELAKGGGKASARELTEWATHISEGRPIKFTR